MRKKHDREEQSDVHLDVETGPVESGAQESSASDPIKEQLTQTQLALAEMNDQNLRLRAEFDNFRKRVRQEQLQDRQKGAEDFVLQLLPILDNFERAFEAAQKNQSVESMTSGVEGILRQIQDLFRRYEIEPIEAINQPFDPAVHEAIQTVPNADLPDHTVAAEMEKGYKMNGRVIRPSRVLVAVRPE